MARARDSIDSAFDAAVDLIKVYVLRGDHPKAIRDSHMTTYSSEYRAGIGGYLHHGPLAHAKQFPTSKILVHEVNYVPCAEVFSFDEIYQHIKRSQQPTLFLL
jgi:hypothetical protein